MRKNLAVLNQLQLDSSVDEELRHAGLQGALRVLHPNHRLLYKKPRFLLRRGWRTLPPADPTVRIYLIGAPPLAGQALLIDRGNKRARLYSFSRQGVHLLEMDWETGAALSNRFLRGWTELDDCLTFLLDKAGLSSPEP
ncbi:MAG: hypothetical protein AB1758_25640 [Candidatus Eremiobacterota bacterium]